MNVLELKVPQLGEGLQEVLIREFLKRPGELIRRNESIYVMETDKAMVEAECPEDGVLQKWLVQINDVVAVGGPVARLQLQPVAEISDAAPQQSGGGTKTGPSLRSQLNTDTALAQAWQETPLAPSQRALLFRLNRSSRVAVPGNIGRPIGWRRLIDIARESGQIYPRFHPSAFQVLAYCVAQATKTHPKFRSTLIGSAKVREYWHLTLGIAVARPGDELVTAVVPNADRLELMEFVNTLQRQVRHAWTRGDQGNQATQLILSYLGAEGMTDGVPVLVAPASGTLFIGAPYVNDNQPVVKLSLTFDHRLINGVAAAAFLNRIDLEVDRLYVQIRNLRKENQYGPERCE